MAATDSGDLGSSLPSSLKTGFFLTHWQGSLGFWGLGAFKFYCIFNSYHALIQVQIKSVSNALYPG